jgi:biotin transporter BioY
MAFHAQDYLITWLWYAAVLVLGSLLLKQRTNVKRVVSGSLLASTSFFAISNYAVWVGSGMYPHTLGGLTACYASALPFYRNDLVSTLLVTGVAFGIEALVHRSREANAASHGQIAA